MNHAESQVVLRQRQASVTHTPQLKHGQFGQQLIPVIHAGRDSKFKQAVLLSWWLAMALVCTIVTGLRGLAGSLKCLLLSTIGIRLGNRRLKISPLAILVMITTGVITAVTMEWMDGIPGLLRPAYSCGDDCCQIWTACDLHIRLSTLVNDTRLLSPGQSAPGSLYAVLDVKTTVKGEELRSAARRIAQRVEEGRYSESTENLVTEVFRAAQFLEVEKNRRLYDGVFMPAVRSKGGLTPGAVISPPREAADVPGKFGLICSAAFGACSDAACDEF